MKRSLIILSALAVSACATDPIGGDNAMRMFTHEATQTEDGYDLRLVPIGSMPYTYRTEDFIETYWRKTAIDLCSNSRPLGSYKPVLEQRLASESDKRGRHGKWQLSVTEVKGLVKCS